MATVINIQRAINWSMPFLKNQRLDFSNMEPALETGNMVLQTMLAPPMKWRQNRGSFSFTTIDPKPGPQPVPIPPQSDYTIAIPDFGFLEPKTLWISDATGKNYAMTGAVSLPVPTSSSQSRPTEISPQYDDSEGNITFRTKEMPNAAYTIGGDYQRKAPILKSPAQSIFPVPDEFGFLFNWGFLTICGMLVNDARVDWWEKKFVGRLLATQDGLDDQAINLFMSLWQTNTKGAMRTQGAVQSGTLGRQV